MRMLSSGSQYGVRAAVYLARRDPDGDGQYVSIRTIAEELGLSFHYMTKVLQLLTGAGLVASYRGPRGGVCLARAPREITVLDLVEAVAGPDWLRGCVLGLPVCDADAPCALHAQWSRQRETIRRLFVRTTLEQLARSGSPRA
jgi:Rrf2 family transcriptional regulator, iron-sulfur cluster assembly transcription factor